MVQGEPILDVPVDDCPGEIGVVCFQVSIIPEKQKEKELDKGRISPITYILSFALNDSNKLQKIILYINQLIVHYRIIWCG